MLCSNQLSYIAIVRYFLFIPLIVISRNQIKTTFSIVSKGREFCRFTSKMSIPELVDYNISNYGIVVTNATAECFLADLLVVAMDSCVFSSDGYYGVKAITDYP